MRALLGAALALPLFVAPASAAQSHEGHAHPVRAADWDEEVLDLFSQVPVQDGGRIKPMYTLAKFKLLKLNARSELELEDGSKLSAVEWLLDCLLFPEQAFEYECFYVRNDRVLVSVGLKVEGKRKTDRWSYDEILPARTKLMELAQQYSHKQPEERNGLERDLLILATNVRELEDLFYLLEFARRPFPTDGSPGLRDIFGDGEKVVGLSRVLDRSEEMIGLWGALHALPPEQQAEEVAARDAFLAELEYFLETGSRGLALVAPDATVADRPAWITPTDMIGEALDARGPVDRGLAVLAALERAALGIDRPAELRDGVRDLLAATSDLADARGEYDKIPMEIGYYRADYFTRALVLFILTFLLVAVSWLSGTSKLLSWSTWGLLGAGAALVVAGIVVRCILRDRPPVSTLYETILFITGCAVLVCMAGEWMTRQRVMLAVAPVLGAGGMFLSMKYELKEAVLAGDTMPSLVAVLDTNFWLATHVTTVTIGYAAGLLAAALAHIVLLGRVFGLQRGNAEFFRNVTRMVYGVICFGLLFSVVGTILGGIWANYSWGRFWGWDPKENGALMICLVELLILHARMGGYAKQLGLNALAVANGGVVAFSWWHVNNLGVGLHSYGKTEGVLLALYTFYAIEAGVLLLTFAWWLGQRSRSAPSAA